MSEREEPPPAEFVPGRMRDYLEVTMYFEVHGCPRCGARDCGKSDAKFGSGIYTLPTGEKESADTYDITCPHCGLRRFMVFVEMEPAPEHVQKIDPVTGNREDDYRHLGGWEHSEIIAPHEFARELAYCAAHVIADPALIANPDPARLADDPIWDSLDRHLCSNAKKCTRELRKFIPEGAAEVPDNYFQTEDARRTRIEHPEWFRRAEIDATEQIWDHFGAAIQAEALRRSKLKVPVDPKVAAAEHAKELAAIRTKIFGQNLPSSIQVLKPAQLAAHADWLAGRGGERLRWEDGSAPGAKLSTLALERAVIAGGTFDRSDFSYTRFGGAELSNVRAHDASFEHADLAGSTIRGCDFHNADFALGNLGDATIEDTNFTLTQLGRTTWYRSKLTRCTFARAALQDAAFDHAEFVDCDFRGADLSEGKRGILGTSFEARFVRCDFRDTLWRDRTLHRAHFIDCKFDGASGPPWLEDTTFEQCEPSPVDMWGIPAFHPRPRDLEWWLPPEELEVVAASLDSIRQRYDRRDDRIATQESHGQQLEARVREALAAYRRSLPPHVLAERVLDAAIDDKLSFDQTVERLKWVGFSHENALEIMIDPHSARPLI